MKNKIIALIISLALIASVCTGLLIAKADQENNMEIPCDHEYVVTDVHDGVIGYTCTNCHERFEDYFSNHINDNDYETLDFNGDGIVNVRDYSIVYFERNN